MKRFVAAAALSVLFVSSISAQNVKINEVNTGTPDYIELMNRGTTAVNVGGLIVRTYFITTAGGATTAEPAFTIPTGTIIQPGDRLVLQETGTAGSPGTLGACAIFTGINYGWTNARSVEVVLLNGAVGVDYVYRDVFNGPAAPNLPAGTTWTGVLSTSGDSFFRPGDVDTNSAADWSVTSGGGTACNLNPGQTFSIPPEVFLVVSTTGVGDLSLSITSSPVLPNAEFYGLYSTQNLTPNGIGPLFGIGIDALPQIYQPIAPGNPFHSNLSAAGTFNFNLGAGSLPPGFFLEGVVVAISGAALKISNIDETTF